MFEQANRRPSRPGGSSKFLHRLLHDRAVRLGVGLAVAVGIPVAVVFFLQLRSLHDLETTSTLVLEQIRDSAGSEIIDALQRDFRAPYLRELNPIVVEPDVVAMQLTALEPLFAEGLQRHPFVDAFVAWSADAPAPAGRVLHVFDRRGVRSASPDETALLPAVRELARSGRGVVTPTLTVDGRGFRTGVRLLYDGPSRNRLVAFVGFLVAADRFERERLVQIVGSELGRLAPPPGFAGPAAAVVDESDRIVYRTGASDLNRHAIELPFSFGFVDPDLFGPQAAAGDAPRLERWRVRVGYGDVAVADIVRARTAPQMALMMALAIVMAGAVVLVALAAVREVRLADLKSDFVSSVSHDLKTPLSLIQLFAETLEVGRVKTPDRALEYYRIINSEAQKLTRLINNILEFSRIEAGLRQYRPAPVSLADLADKVLASLDHQFRQGRFRVAAVLPRDLPSVNVDAEAVARALENLLSNAMKYSGDARDIEVEVAAEPGVAVVRVSDRGIGIPLRHQRRIFRKFYRVQPGGNGFDPQGSGLGLAIVDHVMRAHHGWVRVDSEPGRGSTFTLGFPLHHAREYPEAGWP